MEGRRLAKGNTAQQNTSRTQGRSDAQRALDRVRQAAKKDRKAKFTALMHHVTIELLRATFYQINKNATPGVDEVTWEQYRADLENNLRDLHDRLHSGAYQAQPTQRVYIPKTDGKLRPLGMSTLEDKLAQRAVVEVLNAIYETDFLGFSYGFRPGRGQHDALDALTVGILRKKVNWVFDADIRGFYDTINHQWLMKFLEHRIGDKRILRLIQKWLRAGVMEQGQWKASEEGVAQGASMSPLLANVYLHYAFDLWIQQWRKKGTFGEVIVVRYADDIIVGFQYQAEAVRFQRELDARMHKFSLELHPDKTRLIEFGTYAAERRHRQGMGRPETFNFLGFTHCCGKARSGRYLLIRHTIAKRMRARLVELKREIMRRRHLSIKKQGQWLGRVVQGYLNYHAIPTNTQAMQQFRKQVTRHWHRALKRRSQRDRTDWARMNRLADRWLPRARVLHPWPTDRFDAKTRGGSPVR
jgi:group II intron reverse transcriptase/maturase